MDDKDLGIEYFKALRSEIDLRIKNQAYLTINKIVACGALYGHLVGKAYTKGIAAVPLLAIFLDFVIHHNVAGINRIGRYIRDELENKCFKNAAGKWNPYESSAAQTAGAGVRDRMERFGQLGITIAFFLLSLMVFFAKEPLSRSFAIIWISVGVLLLIDIVLGICLRASKNGLM
ncbi:MAG TPA: hypothetical protein ACFYD3_09870 [Candidatus Hypogeohydataceae bacterium YC41]